jgi:hypothetical protein
MLARRHAAAAVWWSGSAGLPARASERTLSGDGAEPRAKISQTGPKKQPPR